MTNSSAFPPWAVPAGQTSSDTGQVVRRTVDSDLTQVLRPEALSGGSGSRGLSPGELDEFIELIAARVGEIVLEDLARRGHLHRPEVF